jgi:excisionase family DNA binding protein
MTSIQRHTTPLLTTIQQAALLLSVSERTIYRLITEGRLTPVRITPDTPRIPYSQLTGLLARLPDATGEQITPTTLP